ncbi:Trafficking protein Mon1 domain containing protein [Amanita muscaria]
MNERILIQDVDHKGEAVETDETTIAGHVEQSIGSEERKKVLRDQLRKTLNQSRPANTVPRYRMDTSGTHELSIDPVQVIVVALKYQARSYFVLTEAGKPVFVRTNGMDADDTASMIGVMQALISVFLDDNDKLRCINAGQTRITFLMRSPLYYVCASSWGEPESVTRSHLEYLHLQILSVFTAGQLRRIFERRNNFDLRRLLDGAECFLSSLLDRVQLDLAMSMSSLHCLKLDQSLRKRIAETLVPQSRTKDILYVILVVCDQVVALIRPKKHSIHPADIHIILNTIHSPSISNSPASASWIPICLPKCNPQNFAHAYISFLCRQEDRVPLNPPTAIISESDVSDNVADPLPGPSNSKIGDVQSPNVVLVCISTGADMDIIQSWSNSCSQKLESDGLLQNIIDSYHSLEILYSVSDLGIPGLRHFVYKSRVHVQITMPTFEDPYDDIDARRRQRDNRLVTSYQRLHDAIHAKSGQEGTLKLQYLCTEKESLLGWITQAFEVYLSFSPLLPKSAAINAANAVTHWVKKEEGRLFLHNAPVF